MNKQENTFPSTKLGFDDEDPLESKIVRITCYGMVISSYEVHGGNK